MIREDQISYAVIYGEFEYKAATWRQPRRVCFKIEKPASQMTHLFTFIVTNMISIPRCVVQFYCDRGGMENLIKESKNDFDFSAVSSSSFTVNENRLLAHALPITFSNGSAALSSPKILHDSYSSVIFSFTGARKSSIHLSLSSFVNPSISRTAAPTFL